jgi:ABC-2 type transport system permease protein
MRHPFLTLVRLELLLFFRNPAAAFFTLVFPLILLFVFGSTFGNSPGPGRQFGFMDLSVPGYLAMIIGSTGLMAIPSWIASYRERGVFRRLKLTPIGPGQLLLAQGMVGLITAFAGCVLLLIAGTLVFHLSLPKAPLGMLAAFLLGSAAMFSLGAMVASVTRTTRAAQAIGQAFYFPMLFLSGAAFPRALMPAGVRRVSEVLPLTHVTELMSRFWLQGVWRPASVMVLVGVLLVAGAVARRSFRWE